MRTKGMVSLFLALGVLVGWTSGGVAQDISLAARGPRFLYAPFPTAAPTEIDASRNAVLRQVVSLQVDKPTVGKLLAAIERQTGLLFAYGSYLRTDRPVTLRAESISVSSALAAILVDAGVDVVLSPGGHVGLVRARSSERIQVGAVAGRVTDAKTSDALVGAEVWLEGTRQRTTTGEKGFYRLSDVAVGSYTVAVRRVGYAKRSQAVTVVAGQEATVDVALQAVVTQLNEIVTTVTGDQRRLELGHVVGVINADSLTREAPVSSLSDLLTGRVSGVQVFQAQGTVGGKVEIQIRGRNSVLLNNEPIVIVDGVRYASQNVATDFGNGPWDAEGTSPLNDINPNDIETIEVVKGPSAATLYGTDAANGVIVVTTKRGRAGVGQWNAHIKGTSTNPPGITYPDRYWGWRTVGGVPSLTRQCTLERVSQGICVQDSVTALPNPLNDPSLSILQRASDREIGGDVSGGQQALRYYASFGQEEATGMVQMPPALIEQLEATRGVKELPVELREPNALSKVNLRAGMTAGSSGAAQLRVSGGYTRSAIRSLNRVNPFTGGGPSPLGPYGYGATGCSGTQCVDPVEAFAQSSTDHADRFVMSATGEWRPFEWLMTHATAGVDFGTRNRLSLVRRGEAPTSDFANGQVGDDRVRQTATTADIGATVMARRGRFGLRTSVGAQYERNLSDLLFGLGTDLPPGGSSVSDAAYRTTKQTYTETVKLGSFLEQTVGLNDRLYLTGAVRMDGVSTFGRNYDAVFYPKVSASWLISEEPFIPKVSGLDDVRLRYAFGGSGRQPDPAWARQGFQTYIAILNGAPTTVIGVNALGNPNLRPERVEEHEAGVDIGAFDHRVQLGLTWYKRKTRDQIVSVTLPPGMGSLYTNLGLVSQHGFEVELAAQVLTGRTLTWDVRLQHGLHRTNLVKLGGGYANQTAGGGWKEGYPLGARFIQAALGYTDANNDGIVTYEEIQFGPYGGQYAGESTPPIDQTLTTIFGLFDRRIRLSALLDRKVGFTQIATNKGINRATIDPTSSMEDQYLAYVTPVESGDFTRLREMTLAADLPVQVVRALRVRSASVALSGRNLHLWTKFTGSDPETTTIAGYAEVSSGIPFGRTWSLRLDLGF